MSSIGYRPDTMGQEKMNPWCRHIFAPIPLLETRPPTRQYCSITSTSQATSHKSRRSSSTPASYMHHIQTPRPSRYIIGSPPGPYYQRSCKTVGRPDTTSFNLHLSHLKQHGHASDQKNQYQTRSLSDKMRQLLLISLSWHYICQRHQHWQSPQGIIPCQTQLLTQQGYW